MLLREASVVKEKNARFLKLSFLTSHVVLGIDPWGWPMGLDAARTKQRVAVASCDSAAPARTFGPASEETALDTANIVCLALLS